MSKKKRKRDAVTASTPDKAEKPKRKRPKKAKKTVSLDDLRESASGNTPPPSTSPSTSTTKSPSTSLLIGDPSSPMSSPISPSEIFAEEMIQVIDEAHRTYKKAAKKMANYIDNDPGSPEKDATEAEPPLSAILLESQSRFETVMTAQINNLISEAANKDKEIATLKEGAIRDRHTIERQQKELEAGFELAVKHQVDTLLIEIELKNKEITKLKEISAKDKSKISRQRSEIESLMQRQKGKETIKTAPEEITEKQTMTWSEVVRNEKKQEDSHRRETICDNSSACSSIVNTIENEIASISESYNFKPETRNFIRYPNERGVRPHGPHGYDILFNGSEDEFSNLYPCQIPFEGEMFKSVEHAFQAKMVVENGFPEHYETIKNAETAWDAMFSAKELVPEQIRTEMWEKVTKYKIMWQLEKLKYKHCPEYRGRLMSTGNRRLVERTTHKDWGGMYNKFVKRNGENHLGRMHMQIRDERLFKPEMNQTTANNASHTGEKPHTETKQLLIIGTSHVKDLCINEAGLSSQTYTYSGANIPYIRSRVRHILKDRTPPPLILLQAGGIDCDMKNINPSDISIEYNSLISEVKNMCPDSLLMIGQIPTRETHHRGQLATNRNIMRVNNFLKHRSLRGDGVISINICPTPHKKVMRQDGVHFNRMGKSEMQDRLLQSVSHYIRK